MYIVRLFIQIPLYMYLNKIVVINDRNDDKYSSIVYTEVSGLKITIYYLKCLKNI